MGTLRALGGCQSVSRPWTSQRLSCQKQSDNKCSRTASGRAPQAGDAGCWTLPSPQSPQVLCLSLELLHCPGEQGRWALRLRVGFRSPGPLKCCGSSSGSGGRTSGKQLPRCGPSLPWKSGEEHVGDDGKLQQSRGVSGTQPFLVSGVSVSNGEVAGVKQEGKWLPRVALVSH